MGVLHFTTGQPSNISLGLRAWFARHWKVAKADFQGISNTLDQPLPYKTHLFKNGSNCSDLGTLSFRLESTLNDPAMGVIMPPITILPIVLVDALYNWVAKKDLGSIQSLFIIQDKKYNSEMRGTFRLSSFIKITQANNLWATQMQGFLMTVPLQVLVS